MEPLRLLFEVGADFYAWMTWQETWRAHCRELVDRFEVEGDGEQLNILDMGIGPGVSGISIKDRLPAAKVVGLDYSVRMLKIAQGYLERADVDVELIWADASKTPFEDASFDVVTGHSFLYLLPDRGAVVKEIRRVLKPGGRVVFLEPRAGSMWSDALMLEGDWRFKLSMILWRLVSGQVGPFEELELGELFEDGFERVQVEHTLGSLGLWVSATRADL